MILLYPRLPRKKAPNFTAKEITRIYGEMKLCTCGPLLILSSALQGWGTPLRHGLCSNFAQLWANCDLVPHSEALGPPGSKDYVIDRPVCGPPLILFPGVTCWGPCRRHGACSHSAQLWANSGFVSVFEALGTPGWQGLCSQSAHSEVLVTPGGYVAKGPTCGPILRISPALGNPQTAKGM